MKTRLSRGTRGAAAAAALQTFKMQRRVLRPWPCSGFTLIELVISASLTALILTSAYLCLSSGISSQKLVDSRTEAIQSARVAMAMMSADLRGACPLSKNIEFLGMRRIVEEMDADNVDFGTHNYTPRRAREGDFCEISYFVAMEPDSGKFSLWRRCDPTPDDEPLSGGSREEIARGVRRLRLEYYDGWEWFDEWGDPEGRGKAQNSLRDQPNLTGMPEAVRITLSLQPSVRSSTQVRKEGDTGEPPVIMQTVVRLNLAAISRRSSSSSSSTNAVQSATGQPAPATPDGGNP
jgi:type II secretion system protein J